MSVYVNGRFLTQRRSGMQRWAEQILSALDARLDGPGAVTVLRPQGTARDLGWRNIAVRPVGGLGGHLWEQIELAAAARDGVLVNLLSSGPILHPRQIVTFHDAAVLRMPHLFSPAYRALHRRLRPLLARRAAGLLTVSQFSAGELSHLLSVPRGRFVIAPNAAGHILAVPADPEALTRLGLAPGGYGLCVGNQSPNKNIAAAIRAFSSLGRPDFRLVVVGAGDAEVFGNLALADHPGVLRPGYVDDGGLRALYEGAAFLCFPSFYEGFGIPVLEAMALGCPVIASNAAALPETCGGAALLADPSDVAALADAMGRILDQPDLAQDLRARGLARAADFNWDRSAAALQQALAELAPGAGR